MQFYKLPIYAISFAALLSTPVLSGEFRQIKKASDFNATIVGKKLVSEQGTATLASNGKVTGSYGGKALKGTWKWKGEYYCRKIKLGGEKLPNDCLRVSSDGETVYFKRNKGKGKTSPPYTISN